MIHGVVLVGGRSVRFGRDKLREPFAGGLLVERAIAALRDGLGGEVVLVGACAPEVAARGDRAIADDHPGQGPAGGVLTALEHLGGDVLVLAGDLPAITARTIAALLAAARERPDAVVVRAAGEPCIAVYRQVVAGDLRERLARGDRSLFDLAGGDRLLEIDVDPGEVVNANTEGDLAQARRQSGSGPPRALGG